MTERLAGDDFIFTTLSSNSSLIGLMPGGVAPFKPGDGVKEDTIVYLPLPLPDLLTNDRHRVLTQIDYQVRAVVKGMSPKADEAAEIINSLLDDVHVIQNGYRIDSVRFGELNSYEEPSAYTFRFAGARYRVSIRPANLYQ